MRFKEEQKERIIFYLLEKIKQGKENISRTVSEEFGINQATVHSYLNELMNSGVIRRVKRGEYTLVVSEYEYTLHRSEGDLDTDTYAFERCLKEHIADLPQNVRGIWAYAFSTMVNNVMDHSEAETMRVIIRRDYLDTQALILDDGIGIFEKIRSHFRMKSLDEAIQELFKGKLTTDEKNHSGEGIFFTSKLMDEFFILSDGKVFTNNRYDVSQVFDLPEMAGGTGVFMQLSNFTTKNSQEVFDMFSNVDGGFTKTRIPIKNMFDADPVSRSQAKRVCNGLNRFREVEIDFSGVDWMGQGFAHQIFVVFQNEHPEIRLIPINMSNGVARMYAHICYIKTTTRHRCRQQNTTRI